MLDVERVSLYRHFLDRVRIGRQVCRTLQDVAGDVQPIEGKLIAAVVAAISAGIYRLLSREVIRSIARSPAADRAVTCDSRSYGDKAEEITPL